MKIERPDDEQEGEDREQEAGIAQAWIFPCQRGGHPCGPRGRSPAPRRSTWARAGHSGPAPRRPDAAISRKADAAFKERSDRYLVGGIEDGRLGAARRRAPRGRGPAPGSAPGRAPRSRASRSRRDRAAAHGVSIRSGQASV